jgi:hypothetical protein
VPRTVDFNIHRCTLSCFVYDPKEEEQRERDVQRKKRLCVCRAGPRPDHFTPISRNRPMRGRLQTPSPRRFHSAGNKPPVAASLSTALHAEVLGTSNYHYTLKPSAYIRRLRTGYCAAQSICRSGTRLWTVPFLLQLMTDHGEPEGGVEVRYKEWYLLFQGLRVYYWCIPCTNRPHPDGNDRYPLLSLPHGLLGGLQQALLICLGSCPPFH